MSGTPGDGNGLNEWKIMKNSDKNNQIMIFIIEMNVLGPQAELISEKEEFIILAARRDWMYIENKTEHKPAWV